MVNRYIKRCSSAIIIREMQIKTKMRYHFTPVRMDIIEKIEDNKFGKDVEKSKLLCIAGRNVHWHRYYGK